MTPARACLHALWCHGTVRAGQLHEHYLTLLWAGYCNRKLIGGAKADYSITQRGKIEARKIFR